MNTRDYEDVIKDTLRSYCLLSTDIAFVDSVSEWCKNNGIKEPDKKKPLRFVIDADDACRFVINEVLTKDVVEGRLNALRVRSALVNVAQNRADLLDSDKKKLGYLILSEYAAVLPEMDDEHLADEWCFKQMEKKGFFRE